ncbi:hypothetical protein KCU98_g7177, partial [Aureobasidium melanogenum]
MQFSISTIMSVLAATAAALPTEKVLPKRGTISVTPHVEYSSSVSVLGCKTNTNRVAYWPRPKTCQGLQTGDSDAAKKVFDIGPSKSRGPERM